MAVRKPVRLDRGNGRGPPPATGSSRLPAAPAAPAQGGMALGRGCGVALALVLAIVIVAKCASDAPETAGSSARAVTSEPAYVTARSLNCRRAPNAGSATVEGLSRSDPVVVAERSGGWTRLTRVGGDCWVLGSFLASTLPAGSEARMGGPAPSGASALLSSGSAATAAAGAVTAGAGYAAGKAAVSSRKSAGRGKKRSASRGRRGSAGGYDGQGCPCSGARICVGPRGGRYCITSGGNKRYGV